MRRFLKTKKHLHAIRKERGLRPICTCPSTHNPAHTALCAVGTLGNVPNCPQIESAGAYLVGNCRVHGHLKNPYPRATVPASRKLPRETQAPARRAPSTRSVVVAGQPGTIGRWGRGRNGLDVPVTTARHPRQLLGHKVTLIYEHDRCPRRSENASDKCRYAPVCSVCVWSESRSNSAPPDTHIPIAQAE